MTAFTARYDSGAAGRYHRSGMHLGDSIFIFILALVLFGPKKLPEMARQIGKLMAEFRRASNDFRMQIDEELRTMERQEQLEAQRKKQEAEQAALVAAPLPAERMLPVAASPESNAAPEPNPSPEPLTSTPVSEATAAPAGELKVMPPTIGEQVSAGTPYAVSAPVEDHPLLKVDTIPEDPHAEPGQATGPAAAQANAARLYANGLGRHDPGEEAEPVDEAELRRG